MTELELLLEKVKKIFPEAEAFPSLESCTLHKIYIYGVCRITTDCISDFRVYTSYVSGKWFNNENELMEELKIIKELGKIK